MSVCSRGCSWCQSWNSHFFVAVMLLPLVCPPHRSHQHSSGSSMQEKVPGRENWEFVYPNAVALNWLQLFLKIFLGFWAFKSQATGETQVKPNPVKKKPKLLIRWKLHFLIVNSENILPGICLGEGFVRAELKKKKSELNSIVNGKEKSWISVKIRTFSFKCCGKGALVTSRFWEESRKSSWADGWLALSMDAAGSANLGMLKQAVIPRFPAQHLLSQLPRLGVQRESCAGPEGPPGPLPCRENKIWSNLHQEGEF